MKHILSLMLFFVSLGVYSQVPGTLSYQGLLVNASGEPVTDGFHFVKFRFYTAPSDGTLIYETGALQVTTYKGMFTTVIGAGGADNPVLTLDLNNAAYIANKSVYVEITADGVPLIPRVPLTTVTNAQHAHNANVVPASGVTGVLSVTQGGTGVATLTGVFIGNGAGAATGLAATEANQYLKSNADNSAYEFATLPPATASNGLTVTGTDITLGGTLSGNTGIITDGHNLTVEGTGNVGIGTGTPVNKLDIGGGAVVGVAYSGTATAPANGLLVEGSVGIATNTPVNKLDVGGGAVVGVAYSGTATAPANGLLVEGSVGIATNTPVNKLDVGGGAVVGVAYAGTVTAPANGLLVEGNVGIGTSSSSYPLSVYTSTATRGLNIEQDYAGDEDQYGLSIDLSAATGTGAKYGISNSVSGTAGSSSGVYGTYNEVSGAGGNTYGNYSLINHDGSGDSYGFYANVNKASGASGPAVGLYSSIVNDGTSQSYLIYGSVGGGSTKYGTYFTGEDLNYFSGKLGLGTTTPANKLDVEGGVAIGATYSGTNTAPTNGLLVEGNTGIGTASPTSRLHIDKSGTGNYIHFSEGGTSRGYVGISSGPSEILPGDADNDMVIRSQSDLVFGTSGTEKMRLISNGNLGIGTNPPVNKLDVEGGVAIGSGYSGNFIGPTNGLLVQGNVGLGTTNPLNKLDVAGAAVIGSGYAGISTAYPNGLLVQGITGIGTTTPSSRLHVYETVNGDALRAEVDYTGAQDQIGLAVDLSAATGTGLKYGIDNTVSGTVGNTSEVYGMRNTVGHGGNGGIHGQHVIANKSGVGAGTVHGFRVEATNDGTGTTYLFRGSSTGTGAGARYGVYVSGEDLSYFSGKIGLGTTLPNNKLDVEGGVAIGASYSGAEVAPTNGLLVQGNVGIGTTNPGTYKLYVSGTGYITGGDWSASDVRYKRNFIQLTNTLSKIQQLEGFSYEWKRDENPDMNLPEGRHYGFKAQEIEKFFPELISTSETGYKAMNYAGMTPVLLEAIKEQQTQIEQLQAEVAELRKQVTQYGSLSADVEELKKLMKQTQPAATLTPAGNDKK